MTKSEFIERLANSTLQLSHEDITQAANMLLEIIADELVSGGRVEVRGFGSFSLHYRAPRIGRNPKTGASVTLPGKHVPHFKAGKELRKKLNHPDDAN